MKTTLTYEEIEYLNKLNKTIKVETPKEYSKISTVFEKVLPGYIIKLNDNTEIKCAITHNMMSDNKWKTPSELKKGDYLVTAGVPYIYEGQLAKTWEPQED